MRSFVDPDLGFLRVDFVGGSSVLGLKDFESAYLAFRLLIARLFEDLVRRFPLPGSVGDNLILGLEKHEIASSQKRHWNADSIGPPTLRCCTVDSVDAC